MAAAQRHSLVKPDPSIARGSGRNPIPTAEMIAEHAITTFDGHLVRRHLSSVAKILKESELGRFTEKTFMDCLLVPRQGHHAPKFCGANFRE